MSDAMSNIIYSSRINADSKTNTKLDEDAKSPESNDQQQIINLNVSDINEFPLIESTDSLYSPEMIGDNRSSRLSDKILRKEQTLLTSTASFFYDANNYETENPKMNDYSTNILNISEKTTRNNEVQMKKVSDNITSVTNINECINSQDTPKPNEKENDNLNQVIQQINIPKNFEMFVENQVDNESEMIQNEPQIIQNEPQIIQTEDQINSDEPEIIETEPQIIETEPQINSDEPEIIETEPEINSKELEINSKELEINSKELEINSKEPEINSKEPEIISDETESLTATNQTQDRVPLYYKQASSLLGLTVEVDKPHTELTDIQQPTQESQLINAEENSFSKAVETLETPQDEPEPMAIGEEVQNEDDDIKSETSEYSTNFEFLKELNRPLDTVKYKSIITIEPRENVSLNEQAEIIKSKKATSPNDPNYNDYISSIMPVEAVNYDEEDMDLVNAEINCSLTRKLDEQKVQSTGDKPNDATSKLNSKSESPIVSSSFPTNPQTTSLKKSLFKSKNKDLIKENYNEHFSNTSESEETRFTEIKIVEVYQKITTYVICQNQKDDFIKWKDMQTDRIKVTREKKTLTKEEYLAAKLKRQRKNTKDCQLVLNQLKKGNARYSSESDISSSTDTETSTPKKLLQITPKQKVPESSTSSTPSKQNVSRIKRRHSRQKNPLNNSKYSQNRSHNSVTIKTPVNFKKTPINSKKSSSGKRRSSRTTPLANNSKKRPIEETQNETPTSINHSEAKRYQQDNKTPKSMLKKKVSPFKFKSLQIRIIPNLKENKNQVDENGSEETKKNAENLNEPGASTNQPEIINDTVSDHSSISSMNVEASPKKQTISKIKQMPIVMLTRMPLLKKQTARRSSKIEQNNNLLENMKKCSIPLEKLDFDKYMKKSQVHDKQSSEDLVIIGESNGNGLKRKNSIELRKRASNSEANLLTSDKPKEKRSSQSSQIDASEIQYSNKNSLLQKHKKNTINEELSMGDRIYALCERDNQYYPAYIKKIRQVLDIPNKQKKNKIYECVFDRPNELLTFDFISSDVVLLDKNQFIKWDKLEIGDIVHSWNKSLKKYEQFSLCDAYEENPSASDAKKKHFKPNVQIVLIRDNQSNLPNLYPFNATLLNEMTFVQIMTRNQTEFINYQSQPSNTIRLDTRELKKNDSNKFFDDKVSSDESLVSIDD